MKHVVARIRAIILAADDRIEESIKWRRRRSHIEVTWSASSRAVSSTRA
jgi:hypothetical protein